MDPRNLLVAKILLAKFSDFILSLLSGEYDVAHCENCANNGHVTTNLIGRSYALPGDKRKCLLSQTLSRFLRYEGLARETKSDPYTVLHSV